MTVSLLCPAAFQKCEANAITFIEDHNSDERHTPTAAAHRGRPAVHTSFGLQLVAGVGSAFGDDQAGWMVADRVSALIDDGCSAGHAAARPDGGRPTVVSGLIVRRARVPLDIIDWLDNVRCLHVVDACSGNDEVGHSRRLVWKTVESGAPTKWQLNNLRLRQPHGHDFGLTDVLALAATNGTLPDSVIIWAMTGVRFGQHEEVSPGVVQATDQLAARILDECIDQRASFSSSRS